MNAVEFLRARGCRRVAIAGATPADPAAWGADGFLKFGETGDFDGVVVVDSFATFMRALQPMLSRGAIVVPADPDHVIPAPLRNANALDAAWNFSAATNYVARCGLKGNYLEFGVFWGASFYRNYFLMRHWLDGAFYAFDSFAGLSAPQPEETAFTAGDFQAGAYCCNLASFRALGAALGVDDTRIRAVPGFFDKTLAGKSGSDYDIAERSVAVCIIDCDLMEPTADVLEFVSPLLCDGALVYFDDWRLCRASAKVGERAAALKWLAANPGFELIEFTDAAPGVASWQYQWFIFQRGG